MSDSSTEHKMLWSRPELVAWDLAGVICEFDTEHRLEEMAAATGLTPGEVRKRVWEDGIDAAGDHGEYSGVAEMCDVLRDVLETDLDDATLRHLYASAFTIDADVLALVDRARAKTRAALLTNNGPLVEEAMRHELRDVAWRLDPLGFVWRYGVAKPDPGAFEALADQAGVALERIFFVDDGEQHVEAALGIGMDAVLFEDAAQLDRALAQRGL